MSNLPDINNMKNVPAQNAKNWLSNLNGGKTNTPAKTTITTAGGTKITTNGKVKVNIFQGSKPQPGRIPVRVYSGGSSNVFNNALKNMNFGHTGGGSITVNNFGGFCAGGYCCEPYKPSTFDKVLATMAVLGPQNTGGIIKMAAGAVTGIFNKLFGGDDAKKSGSASDALASGLDQIRTNNTNSTNSAAAKASNNTSSTGTSSTTSSADTINDSQYQNLDAVKDYNSFAEKYAQESQSLDISGKEQNYNDYTQAQNEAQVNLDTCDDDIKVAENENTSAEQEVNTKSSAVTQAENTLSSATTKKNSAYEKVHELQSQLDTLTSTNNPEHAAQIAQVKAQLQAAQTELQQAEQEEKNAEQALQTAQSELKTAQEKQTKAEQELQSARDRKTSLTETFYAAQAQADYASRCLSEAKQSLASLDSEKSSLYNRAQTAMKNLDNQNKTQQKKDE